MTPESTWLLVGVLVVAALYSSVGHAGASGYIAVMALAGFGAEFIKPSALLLNVLVAVLATLQFWWAGHFSWRLFWPLVVGSLPAAYIGGGLHVAPEVLRVLLGVVLLFSALRFALGSVADADGRLPAVGWLLASGTVLGFLAGLTGTGGGIFLTPLLLWLRWAPTKTASAVSAAFILVNSMAGLAGYVQKGGQIPAMGTSMGIAALVGGGIGATLGSRKLSVPVVRRLLAVVLAIAGVKLVAGL